MWRLPRKAVAAMRAGARRPLVGILVEPLEPRELLAADTLVPVGSTWRYLDNGSDQGTAWSQPAFNDVAWKAGAAKLGYGGDGEVTRVGFGTNASQKYITTYFRTMFSVTDPAQYTALTLNLLRDDGAVVYLNGKRVVKSNMPADPITYTTRASAGVADADETRFFPFEVDRSFLQAGTNVLAVEIHQNVPTSSDLGFDLSLTAAKAANPDPFTVLMLPDTQFYSESRPQIYDAQINWVLANRTPQNIVFLSHVGDVVQTASKSIEWQRADAAMDRLDGVMPYSVAIGNHDYAPKDTRSGSGTFVQYFGAARYAGRDWYGGSSPDQLNHYQIFSAGPWQFLHITIEWEARDSAIAWAQGVIDAHPNLPVIIATHAYLRSSGSRSTTTTSSDGNSGEQIFQKLVRNNPQVFLTLNGHFCGEANKTSTNSRRQPVFEVMADYQCRTNGGDGWLRLLRFDPAQNRIDATTYSPTLGRFETDANSQFSLSVDFASRFNFAPPQPGPVATTVSFQQGVNGYGGVRDTMIQQLGSGAVGPAAVHAGSGSLNVDDVDGAGGDSAALVRFDGIFSGAGGPIPAGATIQSATLTLQVSNAGSGFAMHRMVQSWSDGDTWNSFGNGIQADGVEARAVADVLRGAGNSNGNIAVGVLTIDVTEAVRAWAAGEANLGWVLLPLMGGTNGIDFFSSEATTASSRPKLTVQYIS
jgi:hypothetical protein